MNKMDGINIDDYTIIERIGQGVTGIIYKVKNKITNELFAMKKMYYDKDEEEFLIQIKNEIKTLQILKNKPNIMIIHDSLIANYTIYIIIYCNLLNKYLSMLCFLYHK